ncbi:potassium transporter [Anaplasmataceae bacterium AB001_6]|nr:potassium transporter [Anaplasmataceae bacterium AB001_6]
METEIYSYNNYLSEVIFLLAASVFVVTLFFRLKISPIIGYFVAGASIGIYGLGLVHSTVILEYFAEFGIVFLLFLIGLELSVERLMSMRLHVFGLGSLQVILTAFTVFFICHFVFNLDSKASIIIGCALALSSTALVLQVLQDSSMQSTQVGRFAIAVLLMQDFAVVPFLVLVPLLSSGDVNNIFYPIISSLFRAVIALVFIFAAGRILLRPFFKIIAATKSSELFMSTTLLIVLGSAYVTEKMDLSMAMGAFVSGLLVAETEYKYEVEKVILPFKKLLLGLFFMTVGMSMDLHFLFSNFLYILLGSIALVVVKTFIILVLARFFGFKRGSAIQGGLLLSQGSEFALILLSLEGSKFLVGDEIINFLISVVTFTMAVTPLLSYVGGLLVKHKRGSVKNMLVLDSGFSENSIQDEAIDIDKHIVIIGFQKVGKVVSKMVVDGQMNYIAIDIDEKVVEKAKSEGFTVYQGDATKAADLKKVVSDRASTFVFTTTNINVIKKATKIINTKFPEANVVVSLEDFSNANMYKQFGVHNVVVESYELGLQLGATALSFNGISEYTLSVIKNRFRNSDYLTLRTYANNDSKIIHKK